MLSCVFQREIRYGAGLVLCIEYFVVPLMEENFHGCKNMVS